MSQLIIPNWEFNLQVSRCEALQGVTICANLSFTPTTKTTSLAINHNIHFLA